MLATVKERLDYLPTDLIPLLVKNGKSTKQEQLHYDAGPNF